MTGNVWTEQNFTKRSSIELLDEVEAVHRMSVMADFDPKIRINYGIKWRLKYNLY